MNLQDIIGKEQGKKAIVLGCGTSAPLINKMKLNDDTVLIGCNDIAQLITPKYNFVVDRPFQFSEERRKTIENTKSEFFVCPNPLWDKDNTIFYEIGDQMLGNIDSMAKIDRSNNSPYMAIIFAYYLGCRTIGLLGVDYTDNHYNANDGKHVLMRDFERIEHDYNALNNALKQRGCNVFNLSPTSIVKSFDKMWYDEF